MTRIPSGCLWCSHAGTLCGDPPVLGSYLCLAHSALVVSNPDLVAAALRREPTPPALINGAVRLWDRDAASTMRAEGKTHAEIAEALGVSVSAISLGLKRHRGERGPSRKGSPRKVDPDEARRLREEGWTYSRIATRFEVTSDAVLKALKTRWPTEYTTFKPRKGAPSRKGPQRKIYTDEARRLHEQGWKYKKIAERFGTTTSGLYRALKARPDAGQP